ncbi:hypothetical protein RISK_003494 [Rhodopirellula islandica]|uniref:Uncharacterized protein n=1 Tax=Rhodopirellula islandica TaxID=595434 RepID=A0A0J1BCW1_RHOIS|nr:hypothetical protein RISK_003494 [Rhodopirellula islandica]
MRHRRLIRRTHRWPNLPESPFYGLLDAPVLTYNFDQPIRTPNS